MKTKTYEFSKDGFQQLKADIRKDKVNKTSTIIYYGIMIVMVGLGLISKDLVIISVINSAINKVTGLIIH